MMAWQNSISGQMQSALKEGLSHEKFYPQFLSPMEGATQYVVPS